MEERTQEIAIEYLEHYKKVKYGMMPEWVWDMAIKALEQKPNSEWEHDHEILKAYSDGASDILDKIRAEIEQLPLKTRTNWDGCCPDIDYPEIEYVDVTKNKLLSIIDKYKAESEDKE